MKRFLTLLVAVLLCSSAAFAQNKGDKYIGGNIGLTIQSAGTSDGDGGVAAGIGFAPEFGYFVGKNFRLGASIGYELSAGTHTFTIAPNFAYYARLCDGLYYTPGLSVGFALAAAEGMAIPGFALGLELFSLEFRPSEHFGFSANLVSLNVVALSKYGVTMGGVGFNLGVNPTVSFKYYF